MSHFLNILLPAIEHFRIIGYWIAFLFSLLESLPFIGIITPGTLIVIFMGFISAQNVLDIGDLIWFTAFGAILGDTIGFYLGKKGIQLFKKENFIFKTTYLERGEVFFKKHGSKSIFIGRFIGPIRCMVPLIAGMAKMNTKVFLFFNILSGIIWATLYTLVGYFFGNTWSVIEIWSTRVSIIILFIILFFSILYVLKQIVVQKGKAFFSFIISLFTSIIQAIIHHQDIQKFIQTHHRLSQFLRKRIDHTRLSGLPLTLFSIAICYIGILFIGVIQDVITSGPIIHIDDRIHNLLYIFRSPILVQIFLWITLFGNFFMVLMIAVYVSVLLWMWNKRPYIIPLWINILGIVATTSIGKVLVQRPRPLLDFPVYIENSFSFPSGHSAIAIGLYGFILYILIQQIKTWRNKINIFFIGVVCIFSIGFSRLYLGVHYLSDVIGGYLLGTLWLLLSISFSEWLKQSSILTKKKQPRDASVKLHPILFAGISSIVIIVYVAFGFYFISTIQIHKGSSTQSQTVFIQSTKIVKDFANQHLSYYTETVTGKTQEPISIIVFAKNDATFVSSFEQSGWILADSIDAHSIVEISNTAIRNSSYPRAPMSPSFWDSKVHDFGFQKSTEANTVRQRHHARFWKTNMMSENGEYVYIGTASFDSGIKWGITHAINPDIDTEKELLFQDLTTAGVVSTFTKEQFVQPQLGKNFSGDQFFTDGKAYILHLKD